jgi:hypothetical protein
MVASSAPPRLDIWILDVAQLKQLLLQLFPEEQCVCFECHITVHPIHDRTLGGLRAIAIGQLSNMPLILGI